MIKEKERRLPEIQIGDSYNKAFKAFREAEVEHLPVIENGLYQGLLSLESFDTERKDSIEKTQTLIKEYVLESDALYKYWELILKYKLTTIPLYDQGGKYAKTIRTREFVKTYNYNHHLGEQGCTLILGIKRNNYTLGSISGIIEEHYMFIEHFLIIHQNEEDQIDVLIKINDECNEHLFSDLRRHNIEIKMIFTTAVGAEILKDRYDELMHYLNV